MKTVTTLEATPERAAAVVLRELDHLEVAMSLPGVDPQWVLAECVRQSEESWVAYEDGQAVAIWGYSVSDELVGPWLLCSDLIKGHSKSALRRGRAMVRYLRNCYPNRLIGNHVARSHTSARAYIRALGFVILPTPGESQFDFFYLPHVS